MNALTTNRDEANVLRVLRDSLYPGAKQESVELVLAYCKARGLDPMLKPVHIVPMYVKENGASKGTMRDVPMPGIALYRIQASRSGHYNGKSEPEFGPDETRTFTHTDRDNNEMKVTVTFPKWCKITVKRGDAAFTATEFWTENYATASRYTEAPNEMWRKRAYGQLAKCAEAQALRMAFPELIGGEPTAEEMEGKTGEPRHVQNLDTPREPAPAGSMRAEAEAIVAAKKPGYPLLVPADGRLVELVNGNWLKGVDKALAQLEDAAALGAWRAAMGVHLASMAEAGEHEMVEEAERRMDLRREQFAEQQA